MMIAYEKAREGLEKAMAKQQKPGITEALGPGVSPKPLLDRYTDRTVRIPMADPSLRSINLSTSAGLAMFEVVRQRAFRGR